MTEHIYVIGDIHGQLMKAIRLLDQADLVDSEALFTDRPAWKGGAATLWCLGDLVDRGPSGIGVLSFIMRLQNEATAVGGVVDTLLGNHEAMLLSAARFNEMPDGEYKTFHEAWQRYGGVAEDLAGLLSRHISWIQNRPAMALVGNSLLIHADSLIYTRYGNTITEVNKTFQSILASTDAVVYNRFLREFAQHRAFSSEQPEGKAVASAVLAQFGGHRIIHGHTPIPVLTGQAPAEVQDPLSYAEGLCIDVDAGLYLGAPGFIYRLPD